MPQFTFDTPRPVDLQVRNAAGTVTVTAADVATSTVEVEAIDDTPEAHALAADTSADLSDSGRLTVGVPDRRGLRSSTHRVAVTVTVPTGSSLASKTASATVVTTGRFAATSAHGASGTVRLDRTDGPVDVHLASGDVTIAAAGSVRVQSASGGVEVGRATGDVDVHSVSGDVRIGVAERSVRAKVVSGSVTVSEAVSGSVTVSATSGALTLGVRRGVAARLDLSSVSGRVRSELAVEDTAPDGGAPLEIRGRTVSGSITVRSAAPAPA